MTKTNSNKKSLRSISDRALADVKGGALFTWVNGVLEPLPTFNHPHLGPILGGTRAR